MRHETIQNLKDEDIKGQLVSRESSLKRCWGCRKKVARLWQAAEGEPCGPTIDDLEVLARGYRIVFLIGLTFGVSESTVCRIIMKVEDVLIQSEQFHLPSKKALQSSDTLIEIVLVYATEQLIERPQKDNAGITAAKRSVTPNKRT